MSGLPLVPSDTRQLTGRPKLLYLQSTASAMNNTGSARLRGWRQGSGEEFLAYLDSVRQEKTVIKKTHRYIYSQCSVKQRECRAGRSATRWFMKKGRDAPAASSSASQTWLKFSSTLWWASENKFAETYILSTLQRDFLSESGWLLWEGSGPTSLRVINVVSTLLKDTCLLCYAHMPGLNRSPALLRCTMGHPYLSVSFCEQLKTQKTQILGW